MRTVPSHIDGDAIAGVLRSLCYVSFGTDWSDLESGTGKVTHSQFFDSLVRFQSLLRRNGETTVTRQAIRLWQTGSAPRRTTAIEFLHKYLIWSKRQAERLDTWSPERLAVYKRLDALFLDARPFNDDTMRVEPSQKFGPIDPFVSKVFQGLMLATSNSTQSESSAFFRGSKSEDEGDQSYFILYRYSTNFSEILKTFVVIQKPPRGSKGIYIFNHFIWGGSDENHMSHVFRECEGAVLKLEKAFYLVGYNFTVPVDKRREPEFYRKIRASSRGTPNGMGLLTFEYDDVHISPGLFGGLTLTVAGMSQPVVSRVAMLHIGTKQSLGRIITDHVISPGELRPTSLGVDIVNTIERLREIGCRRFGSIIESYIDQPTWKDDGHARLAEKITRMIDNTPAWEATKSKANRNRETLQARGAIESYGDTRPRN